MKGYNHQDVWQKRIQIGVSQVLIKIVHWTQKFPTEWGGFGINFDKDGLQHNYNIYVYVYSGSDLFDDIEGDVSKIPFHGGETYRLLTHHSKGATIQVGCDFNHAWDNLDGVAPFDGKPPCEVVCNAMDIEEYILKNYRKEKGE